MPSQKQKNTLPTEATISLEAIRRCLDLHYAEAKNATDPEEQLASYSMLREKVREFAKGIEEEIIQDDPEGEISGWLHETPASKAEALRKFLQTPISTRARATKNNRIFLHIYGKYVKTHLYTEYVAVRRVVSVEFKNPNISMLQREFQGNTELSHDFIDKAKGIYAVYRPFHYNLDKKILISLLAIGESENEPYTAKMKYSYDPKKETGFPAMSYELHGSVVPLGADRAIITLKHTTKELPIFQHGFQLLHIELAEGPAKEFSTFRGVALSAIGARESTAYPFFCLRVDENSIPKLEAKLKGSVELPNSAQPTLKRGHVSWNP